jgi:RHH-type proline utilization regulon transcriptional repressor/proline dehydrogenase/delta 1-pyrroline-5-carboxylate dehydrogenase
VVRDVLISSFQSAGQRCSALRVLFVQEDIAEKLEEMLVGAMAELKVGDPALLATDVGPVIDEEARAWKPTDRWRKGRQDCERWGRNGSWQLVAPRAFASTS